MMVLIFGLLPVAPLHLFSSYLCPSHIVLNFHGVIYVCFILYYSMWRNCVCVFNICPFYLSSWCMYMLVSGAVVFVDMIFVHLLCFISVWCSGVCICD